MLMMKKAIVTGGAGFIGSHLVDALTLKGVQVTVLDKKKPALSYKNKSAKYKRCDIQSAEAFEFLQKEKVDVIFHLAAHIHDRESVREPVKNAEHNIIGTLNLLEAVKKQSGVRVVFASTGGVIYGNQEEYPVKEDALPRPLTPYAISKLTCEKYLAFYHRTYGTSYAALRFSNVFGPRQDSSAESGAVGIFSANLLNGESVYINNDGETTRDYVYVADAVNALIRAAESDHSGVLNIGTGRELKTVEVFEIVRDSIGSQAAPEFREDVKDIVKRSALDFSHAERVLGWKPEYTFEQGAEETIQWYRENV